MKDILVLVSLAVFTSKRSLAAYNKTLPNNFLLGIATSAYQVEGAWNADGKGESIWDYVTHYRPELIQEAATGDVACDSYNKYREDVEILKDLGVDFYRFSIPWTRIVPNGLSSNVNQKGIDHYNALIDLLLENGIQPMVTLYHWDLPQYLQKLGGWMNPIVVKHFTEYSRIAFENFGDRVKTWTTINEPSLICQHGYGAAVMAPGIKSQGLGEYLCTKNVLKAHASVYHLYNNTFRATQKGKVGIVLEAFFPIPASEKEEDVEAQNRRMQFLFGLYAHPILHPDGNYPPIVTDRVAYRSENEGFRRSRLQPLTQEDASYIKGTTDYLGINHYTSDLVAHMEEPPFGDPTYHNDISTNISKDPSWPTTNAVWLTVVPQGFRKFLAWIKSNYGDVEIIITENGYSDEGGLDDQDRINYFREYMDAMLGAIYEDGVRITAYTAWSLMDSFEWNEGYTFKFGLYHVNFSSPNLERTPKASARYLKNVLTTRCISDTGCT